MKFNFKKSAKYIICTLLTLTVVATVVFLPRFYYSVTDNRDSVGNTAETFKLTADITTLSGGEIFETRFKRRYRLGSSKQCSENRNCNQLCPKSDKQSCKFA